MKVRDTNIQNVKERVIYVADKDMTVSKTKLSKNRDIIADWLDEKGFVINVKKHKTESLLFGTSQRIAKQNESLGVIYRGSKIKNTTQYKYLGIDRTLNLNTHFEKCFKCASSRLRLLAKVRDFLDFTSAEAVYDSMILPIFTYSGVLQLKLSTNKSE